MKVIADLRASGFGRQKLSLKSTEPHLAQVKFKWRMLRFSMLAKFGGGGGM